MAQTEQERDHFVLLLPAQRRQRLFDFLYAHVQNLSDFEHAGKQRVPSLVRRTTQVSDRRRG